MELKFKRIFLILSLLFILMISSGVAFAATADGSVDIATYGGDINCISESNNLSSNLIVTDLDNSLDNSNGILDSNNNVNANVNDDYANTGSVNVNANTNDDNDNNDYGNVISLNANGGSFSDIQNLINRASDGDTITIEGTFIGSGTHITINKNISIISTTGATLDAKGLSNIFYITARTVYLENLNFINGKDEYGGAIYAVDTVSGSTGSSLNIVNSKFKNNNASIGGAIYQDGVYILNITNTDFENNIATYTGGAIYADAKTEIQGGMINYRYVNVFVNYCNFTGNKALKINGGAIGTNIYAPINVNNTRFVSNYALSSGGAIFSNDGKSIIKVINSEFIENSAKYGGAIHSLSEIDVHYSEFIRNNASYDGGAILEGVNVTVILHCNFTDNHALRGPAIRTGGPLSISDSKVTDKDFVTPIFFAEDPEGLLENATITILNKSMLVKNGQEIELTATLSTNGIRVSGGNLVFKFNTKEYASSCSDDGYYTVKYTMGSSNTKVTTNFPNYNLSSNSINLYLYSITVNNNSVYGEDTVFTLNLPSDFSGRLGFKLDDGSWVYKDVSGSKFNYNLSNLAIGNHKMLIKFDGNSKYEGFSDTINFVINKVNTVITVTGIYLTVDGTTLEAYIRDANGKGLSAKTLNLNGNGTQCSNISDANGKVIFNFKSLDPGKYTLNLNFAGDSYYYNSSLTISLTVGKLNTNIRVNNLSSIYGKTILDAYISDEEGGSLALKNLTLTLNGTKYYAISDNSGKASFNLTSLVPGNYVGTISFNEDKNYYSSSTPVSVNVSMVSTVITVNDLYSKYGKTILDAYIYDGDGLALVNMNLTLTLNGTKYYAISDNSGKVSFNLTSLVPGSYVGAVSFVKNSIYDGSSKDVSVNVSMVSTVISVSDLYSKYGVTVLDAYIRDGDFNPLVNMNLTLTLNGTKYYGISDDNGKVSFNLTKLVPGSYVGAVSFVKNSIYDGS
ncbi:MAG: hypothetical protein Q4P14_02390, partial [Methanobacteriaceae archaeon]|nr:hypothetical protein [Methanobacteriaceae archaeon]